jgi:hypothetical protein
VGEQDTAKHLHKRGPHQKVGAFFVCLRGSGERVSHFGNANADAEDRACHQERQ